MEQKAKIIESEKQILMESYDLVLNQSAGQQQNVMIIAKIAKIVHWTSKKPFLTAAVAL